MKNIIFLEESHTYIIDGQVVPSVTQIIPRQDFLNVPEHVLENARNDGIEKHQMIKDYFDGKVLIADGNEFIIKFHEFLEKNSFGKLIQNEKPMYSKKYNFAGTPDMIFENAIIDFKRSINYSNIKNYSLQLAAYNLLCKEYFDKDFKTEQYILYQKEGEFKLKNVYNPDAERIFLFMRDKYFTEREIENYYKKGDKNERF